MKTLLVFLFVACFCTGGVIVAVYQDKALTSALAGIAAGTWWNLFMMRLGHYHADRAQARDREWLLRMYEKEGNGIISVGGLVSRMDDPPKEGEGA